MNPKDLGTVEEMKARARAGICRRKRMNESTCKKIKRSVASLATLFAAVLAASFSQEAVTAPFGGSFDALQLFVSWLSAQPRQEVDCYELFAGKARISEAFAKGAAMCCSPVTSFSATIYKTVLCKTSGYIALSFSGWPHHALFGVALASSTILLNNCVVYERWKWTFFVSWIAL